MNDRLACEAFADAMGIELEAPAPLELDPDAATNLYDVVVANLHDDVSPALASDFERNRSEMAALLVESLKRERAFEDEVTDAELTELTPLLGTRPASVTEGIAALNDAVPALDGRPAGRPPALPPSPRVPYRDGLRADRDALPGPHDPPHRLTAHLRRRASSAVVTGRADGGRGSGQVGAW